MNASGYIVTNGGWKVIRKILVTAAAGAAAYLLTNLARQPAIWVLTMSVFVGGVSLVVQFLVDFETQLGLVDRRHVEQEAQMRKLVNRRFAKVSTATELFSKVEAAQLRTDTVVELVQYATRIDAAKSTLAAKLVQSELRSMVGFLKQVTNNMHAEYPGGEQDWLFALVESVQSTVKATSTIGPTGRGLVDEGFWNSQEGRTYLERQREAIRRRGVLVQRIFIAYEPKQAEEAEFRQIVRRNIEAGVQVRILTSPPPNRTGMIDFIVFDDEISYEFASVPPLEGDAFSMIQSTQLELREEMVQRRRTQFGELWEAAEVMGKESQQNTPSAS